MSRLKKTFAVSRVLKGFRYDQPFIGFRTQFRSRPITGRNTSRTHTINYGGSCREELVWDSREYLQGKAVTWKPKKDSYWEKVAILTRTLDLDHPNLKQPETTYLWVKGDEEVGFCHRPCCISRFPELLDAIVGPVAVALNPDRYEGNWWTTSPEETASSDFDEIRWYGTDNFFLRHPVLTSLMMGMFRQGVLLHNQGYDEAILKAVKRKDVEECLTNADPVLAMRLLKSLRPWLEVSSAHSAHFAFAKGYWNRLNLLHRSIYKHGYQTLFDADLQQSWNIGNVNNKTNGHGRYQVANGPVAYWGTTGNKVTKAGKRLVKLGT